MIVGIKDGAKLFGITVMSACAVFVCTLFLNYNLDLAGVKEQITDPQSMVLYDALVSMGKVVCMVSGGCLLVTSGIMLMFYIKNYIDVHKKELGILKALGYSNLRIAKDFRVFAVSVFVGTTIGYGGAFLMLPNFYRTQNEEGFLPDFAVQFHPGLAVSLIFVPTLVFGLLAVFYACMKLRRPTIDLLKERTNFARKTFRPGKEKNMSTEEAPFLKEMQRATLRSKKTLVFFIVFGSFCYSSMMQMAGSMDELASEMFAIIIFMIGLILSCLTLLLAVTTVVHDNTKTISMMRVFGYRAGDCKRAVLEGYRIPAYIGFAIGTAYQYGLLKMTVTIIFRDWEDIPEYAFDLKGCIIVLISFVILYELMMLWYADRIRKISLKEVMME